jgi:hypothetical protein
MLGASKKQDGVGMGVWCLLPVIGGVWLVPMASTSTRNMSYQEAHALMEQGGIEECGPSIPTPQLMTEDRREPGRVRARGRKAPSATAFRLYPSTPQSGTRDAAAEQAYADKREREIKRQLKNVCTGCEPTRTRLDHGRRP